MVLSPSRAFAEWVSVPAAEYSYVSTTQPTSFKVSPLASAPAGYANLVPVGSLYGATSTTNKVAFNTAPSASAYLVRMKNIGGGQLAEGNVINLTGLGVVQIAYTTVASPSTSDYGYKSVDATEYRYFVSRSGNTDTTEIYPNDMGVFVMPFTAQYLFVTCKVSFSGMTSYKYWNVFNSMTVSTERPEDQNEVAAINDQTEQFMSTEGADTSASDVVAPTVEEVQKLDVFSFLTEMSKSVEETVTTQDEDSTAVFPGFEFKGFKLEAQTIDPMALLPDELQTVVRLMVTFVFCTAFVSHITHLVQAIFGIYEYGLGVDDFGMGTYDMGPQPRAWKADYGSDIDLGF